MGDDAEAKSGQTRVDSGVRVHAMGEAGSKSLVVAGRVGRAYVEFGTAELRGSVPFGADEVRPTMWRASVVRPQPGGPGG
jgi:hypothetical protein